MRPLERQRCLRALKTYFGLEGFRPGQEQAVEAILRGRDLLCLFPTGAGKSLCFQLPALLMDGPALVVSPLIALMRDQAAHLQARGIPAVYLDSLMPREAFDQALLQVAQGAARLVYVSPERLQSAAFQRAVSAHPPALLVVDEAHCAVQWGERFRPAYSQIGAFAQRLPRRPVICAMTATADRRMRKAICRQLGLRKPAVAVLPLLRENLRYSLATTLDCAGWLHRYLAGQLPCKGLVFCHTRAACEQLSAAIASAVFADGRPLRVGYYHAGMDKAARGEAQRRFTAGEVDVLCCTSAFGMGVDVPDIRWCVHACLPPGVLDYAQQSGRVGGTAFRPTACCCWTRGRCSAGSGC